MVLPLLTKNEVIFYRGYDGCFSGWGTKRVLKNYCSLTPKKAAGYPAAFYSAHVAETVSVHLCLLFMVQSYHLPR